MNRIPIVAILLLILPVAAAAETQVSDEAVLRELKEVLWPRAYAQQDVELLDATLAGQGVITNTDENGPY